jgi:hypothetical protein
MRHGYPGRRDALSRDKDLIFSAIAVLCVLVLHYVDTRTEDTQFAFFALVGFSFILGAIHASRAWLNALIVGMGVALPQMLSAAGLYAMPYSASVPGAFVILAIGLVGGYAGKMTRSVLQPDRHAP